MSYLDGMLAYVAGLLVDAVIVWGASKALVIFSLISRPLSFSQALLAAALLQLLVGLAVAANRT